MTPRNIGLVFKKEIRDTLRDRRTLFIAVVLPIFLYPLLMIGLSQVTMAASRSIWKETQKVALKGASGTTGDEIIQRLLASDPPLEVVPSTDPEEDMESGDIDAWVEVDPGFATAIDGREQGDITVHYDSTDDASQAAGRKVRAVFSAFATEILRDKWNVSEEEEKHLRSRIEPVELTDNNVASAEEKGAKKLGPMLALLLVIMALSGAFYPAVDIMAGEKERGTMETLLVCPATRTEIVAGKFLTVLTMTVVTALLNFASMAITFAHFASLIPKSAGQMELHITPTVAVVIVLALLPLAALFSAVALALSTFARSYKEGQHYLTPMFLGVMPLAMVAMIPGTNLSSFAAVPVAGVVLLVREQMMGTAGMGEVLTVLLSTAAYAAFAIWLSVKMFNKEDVLFRDPGGTKFTLFKRAKKRGQVPSPGQAIGLAAVCMVLIYFLLPRFVSMPRAAFLFQFLGLMLGLPLLAIYAYKLDLRKTLSLRAPPARAWPAVVIGAPAVFIVVMTLVSALGVEERQAKQLDEAIREMLGKVGLPLLLLLPPVVEEVLFRGFMLSGFRNGLRPAGAVVLVAVIFAIFHQMPARYIPTGVIGIWLGYVVIATGSLYPAILAHLLNNAIPFLAMKLDPDFDPPKWLVVPAISLVIFAVYLLELVRQTRGETSADETGPKNETAPG